MALEKTEYITVDEKALWSKESVTFHWERLQDFHIKDLVEQKIGPLLTELNKKIDEQVDAWLSDFQGQDFATDEQKTEYLNNVKNLVDQVNAQIESAISEYWAASTEYTQEIIQTLAESGLNESVINDIQIPTITTKLQSRMAELNKL